MDFGEIKSKIVRTVGIDAVLEKMFGKGGAEKICGALEEEIVDFESLLASKPEEVKRLLELKTVETDNGSEEVIGLREDSLEYDVDSLRYGEKVDAVLDLDGNAYLPLPEGKYKLVRKLRTNQEFLIKLFNFLKQS